MDETSRLVRQEVREKDVLGGTQAFDRKLPICALGKAYELIEVQRQEDVKAVLSAGQVKWGSRTILHVAERNVSLHLYQSAQHKVL